MHLYHLCTGICFRVCVFVFLLVVFVCTICVFVFVFATNSVGTFMRCGLSRTASFFLQVEAAVRSVVRMLVLLCDKQHLFLMYCNNCFSRLIKPLLSSVSHYWLNSKVKEHIEIIF